MFSIKKHRLLKPVGTARFLVGVAALLVLAAPALAQTFAPGDFCTYTQGGWGAVPQGNNPGTILLNNFSNFSKMFLDGDVEVGGGYLMKFTNAARYYSLSAAGGKPKPLDGTYTDPTTTKSGVFGGQVLALQLNVLYDTLFGGLTIINTGTSFDGMMVADVLGAANIALGGGALPSGYTLSNLNDLVSFLNQGFDNCLPSGWAQQYLTPASGGGGSLPPPV